MSEQIKYEAVFGDQDLFIPAPSDAIVVRYGKDFYNYEPEVTSTTGKLRDNPIVAMRRIIRTPVWTREDQEAGRLPDVGVTVIVIEYEEECKVAAINNNAVCVVFDDGEFITLHVSGISPIEKPEERQQREENEFVTSFLNDLMPDSSLQWRCIFERGVRAAYRKLKMPEVKK